MRRGKKGILKILAISAGPLLTALFLVWFFSLEGSQGLSRWSPKHRFFLNAIILLNCLAPMLAVLMKVFRRIFLEEKAKFLSYVIGLFSITGLILALATGLAIIGASMEWPKEIPRLLLLENSPGNGDSPTASLSFTTAIAERIPMILTHSGGPAGEEEVLYSEKTERHQHLFTMKGLAPGSEYLYSLGNGYSSKFRVPGKRENIGSGLLFRFVLASDPHFGNPRSDIGATRAILGSISSSDPPVEAVFLLGDTVDEGMKLSQWVKAAEMLSEEGGQIPLRPLIGESDAILNGTYHYQEFFYPEEMSSSSSSKLYGRLDVGKVHILQLKLLWGTESFRSDQRVWLEKELDSIPPDEWIIVMSHCMYFASGVLRGGMKWYDHEDTIRELVPIFEKYGVDLVFSGHLHAMEYLLKDGVAYFVSGTMGGDLELEREHASRYTEWYQNGKFGYIEAEIFASSALIIFKDENGKSLKRVSFQRMDRIAQ